MQRGWRSTGTNAVKRAPSPEAMAGFGAGGSAASSEFANHGIAAITSRTKPDRRIATTPARFIQPPSYEWATGGCVFRSRQKSRWQWPERRRELLARRFLRPFLCSRQYEFQ